MTNQKIIKITATAMNYIWAIDNRHCRHYFTKRDSFRLPMIANACRIAQEDIVTAG